MPPFNKGRRPDDIGGRVGSRQCIVRYEVWRLAGETFLSLAVVGVDVSGCLHSPCLWIVSRFIDPIEVVSFFCNCSVEYGACSNVVSNFSD